MKCLLNAVQYVQYFASKYLKPTFEKSHMKYGPLNLVWYEVLIKHGPIGPTNILILNV